MYKLTRWIDLQNEGVCLKINQIYNQKIDLGYSLYYAFHPLFYPYYFLRLLLIIFNFFRFNKKLYEPYLWAWCKNNYHPDPQYTSTSRKVLELFFTFLGLRFFVKITHEPHYYQKAVSEEFTFDQKTFPKVSIIVHSLTSYCILQACLKSIFTNTTNANSYEVIVVDDTLSNEVRNAINDIKGLTYIKNEITSEKFNSNNKAIELARGSYVCFLNAQTIVLPLWLESLVDTMEEDPMVGCVGSKLLTPLGLIKHAGGVIDENGQYHKYGDYQHNHTFNCDYKRPVDFCYPINMLFKKADLEQINNFDNKMVDMLDQAIDACFSIRYDLGKKIIYQPSSTLIDHQLNSSNDQLKKFNHASSAFVQKWKDILKTKYQFIDLESAATRFLPKNTISVIDSYLPIFDKESGSNRLFHLLKIFQQLNYRVNFIPNDGKCISPYYRILTAKLGIPVVYNFCGKSQFRKAIFNMINRTEILWISRPKLNLKYQYLVKYFPRAKWIYDTVDLHYVRLFRQAENEKRPHLIRKAIRIKKLELALAKVANATVAITPVEKDLLVQESIENVFVIPNVHGLKKVKNPVPFAQREGILFIGGYKHEPNVDAVNWLIKEIMPIVRLSLGDIPVYLLGSYPTEEVLSLATNTTIIPGYLEDVSNYFLNSRVFVAPLRYGAGMKGKIGQSLEFGLPIVSTAIGAEGMALNHDESVLIANNTQEFANQVIKLYKNQAVWEKIQDNSIKSIEEYTPKMVEKKLQSLFQLIEQENY